jgi:hypothetical protein
MSSVRTPSATLDRRTASAARRWLVLVVVAVAQLMLVLDATIVNIALPSAQQALGFSNSDRQLVVTARRSGRRSHRSRRAPSRTR